MGKTVSRRKTASGGVSKLAHNTLTTETTTGSSLDASVWSGWGLVVLKQCRGLMTSSLPAAREEVLVSFFNYRHNLPD